MKPLKQCKVVGCDNFVPVWDHGNSKHCSDECKKISSNLRTDKTNRLRKDAAQGTYSNLRLFENLLYNHAEPTITLDLHRALQYGFEPTGYILEEKKEDNLYFYLNEYVFFYSSFGTTTQLHIKKHAL